MPERSLLATVAAPKAAKRLPAPMRIHPASEINANPQASSLIIAYCAIATASNNFSCQRGFTQWKNARWINTSKGYYPLFAVKAFKAEGMVRNGFATSIRRSSGGKTTGKRNGKFDSLHTTTGYPASSCLLRAPVTEISIFKTTLCPRPYCARKNVSGAGL